MMILGIDIGGTNITIGQVKDGKVANSVAVKSFDREWDLDRTLEYLGSQIDTLFSAEVEGIGFGVPTVVDVEKGIVYDAANIPSWKEVELKSIFEKKYGCPVRVNNDSNCYALGAYASMPEASRPGSMVAMTLGTGVGMGIVIGGKLFCGANCGAGELSCLPYMEATIEDYTSKKFFHNRGTNPKTAHEEALAGKPEAIALLEEYGRHIGYAVSAVLYAYDPQTIVLGGGVSNNFPLFRDSMYGYLKQNFPYPKTVENIDIVVMTDELIPVLGAASLI